VPLILASDKTQLSVFSGDKTAYPVYLTLGNIPKSLRRKPSANAQILIAYLPTQKLDDEHLTAREARAVRARLFHKAMSVVMKPLKMAMREGVELTSGIGNVYSCHPIPACYSSDYPEQSLVTCTRCGRGCPKDRCKHHELGDHARNLGDVAEPGDDLPPCTKWAARTPKATLAAITAAQKKRRVGELDQMLIDAGVIDVPEPFWRNLAHTNIHKAITPDVLHMLYQGVIKHLLKWLRTIVGTAEFDARFMRLPPGHALRHFLHGITKLSNVLGNEHRQICRQLLGCMVEASNVSPAIVRATRSLLDFLYLAQYRSHSESTLAYLQKALDEFHADKQAFLSALNEDGTPTKPSERRTRLTKRVLESLFQFPKLHALQHFVDSIRDFGTTDNYNTETTERLHINFAKNAYQATNRVDPTEQMVTWLEHQEKLATLDLHVRWRLGDKQVLPDRRRRQRARERITVAQNPSIKNLPVKALVDHYGAGNFESALRSFVIQYRHPGQARYSARRGDEDIELHAERFDVWHRAKFEIPDLQLSSEPASWDTLHAEPRRKGTRGKVLDSRFDTVFVKDTTDDVVGVIGKSIARLCILFSLG
jgi:hypothetical protein